MGEGPRFGVLGPLRVVDADGAPVALGGPRPRALLALLLLDAGAVVPVDRLVDGQYGDDPPAGAANAVQAQVSRLRRALPGGLVEFAGGGYRIAVDPADVDAHRFTALAREGRALLAAGRAPAAATALREGLDLWRGPALPDLPAGHPAAVRLDALRLDAREDLAEAELALPGGTSVAALSGLVAEHPLRERLRALLMRALHAAGRPAEALEEYERLRRLLRTELGTDPAPEVAAVHQAILRAEHPAPPRRAAVPAQLTSFVGRRAELDRLAALGDARLVTVVGPGGMGKTRLAVEHARGREACFVELAGIDRDDAVAPAVLAALGVRDGPGEPEDRLVTAVADDALLLVLDNCEQVAGGAARLVRALLGGCPAARVLATSREPLGLTGETLLPLGSLPAAATLFAERAAAVRPGFALDPATADTVERICADLDGLPLAIELAAARLRQFGLDALAGRLTADDRFRVLSRGDPTAAARHRTLEAVVAWSWDLLTPDEQALARRFAVFAGGAPAAAVEPVCGLGEDVLAELVDRSLVETDGERYRMLETVRLFCARRLDEAGERDATARAHARYFLELAREADPHLRRAEQLDWLARLSAEDANLGAALRRSVADARETAFGLVAALSAFWWLSGRHGRAGEVCAELLGGEVPDGLDEEYVAVVAHAAPRPGPEHWRRAETIMRTPGRELRYPFGAAMWGMTAGPPEDAVDTDRLLGSDPWSIALGRLSQVLLGLLGGRAIEGEREMTAALAGFGELGDRWGCAQALDWLALVASWRGEWGRAHEQWAEALRLHEQLGALDECAGVLFHRGDSLLRQGSLDAAAADYERAQRLWAAAGQPQPPNEVRVGLAEIAARRGDPAAAQALLDAALAASRAGGFGGDWTVARVLTALGRLAETTGDAAAARRWHGEALAAARQSPLASDLADVAEGQAGAALLDAGEAGAARAALLLGAAVTLRGMAVTGDAHVARLAAAARDRLGPDGFAAAYARGAALPIDEARAVVAG